MQNEKMETEVQPMDVAPYRRMRYLMTFLIFMSVATAFCMRVTLSIGVVAMTDNTTNPDFDTFDWDLATQGTTLSAFFWGYLITNIPSGVIIMKYGPRWILLGAMIICTIATYLIPAASYAGGWEALCALRVIQGLTQGAVFPSLNVFLSKWAPPAERGRLGSIAFSGMQAGNMLTLPISGILASSGGGWPSIFYVFASLAVVWCILWIFLGYNTPDEHPYISQAEKEYLASFKKEQSNVTSFHTPWLAIVQSIPVWAILITHSVQNWGFYMLLNEMPTYMNDILQFNIQDNGALTALPYIVMFCLIYFNGWLADLFIQRKIFKVQTTRKIFNSIGMLGPMCTMIGLTFVGLEQKEVAVALLVLSAALNSAVYVGFQVNHIELSPNFCATLLGITNGIGNCFSMVVPIAVGAVVTEKTSEEQWHNVFWITAGMYLFGSAVFVIFGSSELQPWNETKKSKEEASQEKC